MRLVRELGISAWSWSRVVLALGAVVVACSGRSVDSTPKSCATDADCDDAQRCSASADRPVIGMAPCARATLCTDGDNACASSNEVCAPSWQSLPDYPYCGENLCAPPCTADSCPRDAQCGTDGVCRLTACDAPDADPCPELWRCDPEAAKTASRGAVEGTTVAENTVDTERFFTRGCVRKACDEEGGYRCAGAWSCKPGADIHPVGCVADDCQITGHCSDDSLYVCRDEAKHLERGPLDVHNCLPRTCDDGFGCDYATDKGVIISSCSYGAPSADYYGCVTQPCAKDDECFYDYVCEPTSTRADDRGCRSLSCTEGKPCPGGLVCDPNAASRDAADCALPDGSGGAGGTVGAPGTTGGTSGGAPRVGGAGGTPGGGGSGAAKPIPRGQCVAR